VVAALVAALVVVAAAAVVAAAMVAAEMVAEEMVVEEMVVEEGTAEEMVEEGTEEADTAAEVSQELLPSDTSTRPASQSWKARDSTPSSQRRPRMTLRRCSSSLARS